MACDTSSLSSQKVFIMKVTFFSYTTEDRSIDLGSKRSAYMNELSFTLLFEILILTLAKISILIRY